VSEYPWGPHGPRVEGPPSVTPNPTTPWAEPGAAAPGGTGGYVQPTYVSGASVGGGGPLRRSLWLAIPLAWFFGPVGLLYAIGDSKPQLAALAAFVAAAAGLHYSRFQPPVHLFHPILLTCAVWSVFAARAYNRRHHI